MKTNQKTRIAALIKADMPNLANHLRQWTESHLVEPRKETFSEDSEGKKLVSLWRITDNKGSEDSSYRIVFDDETDMFGLETTLQDGTHWFMGSYGSFAEAINNM